MEMLTHDHIKARILMTLTLKLNSLDLVSYFPCAKGHVHSIDGTIHLDFSNMSYKIQHTVNEHINRFQNVCLHWPTWFKQYLFRDNTSIIQISLVMGSACLLYGRGRRGGPTSSKDCTHPYISLPLSSPPIPFQTNLCSH